MEEQLKFIEKQIDSVSTTIEHSKSFLGCSRDLETDRDRIIHEKIEVLTGIIAAQQATIESVFNLLKAVIK